MSMRMLRILCLCCLLTVACVNLASAAQWKIAEVNAKDGKATVKGNMMTIEAGGADIWSSADGMMYVYQETSGDFAMAVTVHSLEDGHATWAKAGIMIRQDLDPGAPNVYAASIGSDDRITWQIRPQKGAASTSNRIAAAGTKDQRPVSFRVERKGKEFFGTWAQGKSTKWIAGKHDDGTPTLVYSPNLTDPILVGVGVTAHQDDAAGTITKAEVEVIEDPFAVEAGGKLSTTWGDIKRSY